MEKNKKKDISFNRFGNSFQENLVNILINDREFSDQLGEVLKPEYFEMAFHQEVVFQLYEYRKKYRSHPSKESLLVWIRENTKECNSALKIQLKKFFDNLREGQVPDEEFIKDTSLEFCRKNKLEEALREALHIFYEKDSASYDEISSIVNQATQMGLDRSTGHDYIVDLEERFVPNSRTHISTGWAEIDAVTKGGLGKGELAVVVAPSGVGKSFAMSSVGAHALRRGRHVIHYTLELSDVVIGQRYDAKISETSLNDHMENKEKIRDFVAANIEGSLIIKEYPTKSATTHTIRSHIEKYISARGHTPDLIIVDYADILRPVSNPEAKRHGLEEIYTDLRAIAMEYNVAMLTASQTNRTGLNAEIITMEAISEAFNKCFVADFIWSMSRPAKTKHTGTGNFFVAKNRNGPDGIVFPIIADLEYSNIIVLPRDHEIMEKMAGGGSSAIDKINERYLEYRKAKKSPKVS